MILPGLVLAMALPLAAEPAPQAVSKTPAPRRAAAAQDSTPHPPPVGAVAFEALRAQADAARSADRQAEAIALYEKALALQPTWNEGRWILGTMYYDLDRYRECRESFAAVTDREPQHGAAWAFEGLCAFGLGEYREALTHLTRADELGLGDQPQFQAVVGYHRGILLSKFGQFERAFDVYTGFVRGGGITPEIVEGLGIAALRMPLLPSEVPEDKRELVNLGGKAGIFLIGMRKQEAEEVFAEMLAKYGNEPNVHYLYGTFLAREKPVEALEQFTAELARTPDHVLARLWVAQELVKQNDFAGAAPYATEAARLAPDNYLARKVLGQVKLQTGDTAGAVVELEAARTLEPSSPSVRYQLSRAYQRIGRTEDAKRERAEFSRLEGIQQKKRGGAAARESEQ